MDKNVKMGIYTRNGVENTFNYFTALSATDKLKFVKYVTNTLVEDDYNSVIRNIIFDYAIIKFFTQVDVSDIDNSANVIDDIEDFLFETNIVNIVKANVDTDIIEELNSAIDDNIAYRTGIHKNPIAESLSNLLNTVEKKIDGIDTKSMMKMAKVLSGISGELNADKVLEAYAKSDLFKKNREELTKSKESEKMNADEMIDVIQEVAENKKKTRNNKKVVPMK